jgi:heme a synthase
MAGPVAGGGGEQLRRFRRLADLTALVTFLLIVVGGIVRVSQSGLGCGPGGSGTKGWPLCGGQVIPLVGDENRVIEFSHRFLASVVVVLIALLCWRAYKYLREGNGWAFRGSLIAGVLVLVQAGLGGLTVEHGLAEELVAAHLGAAMLLLGLLLWLGAKARSELRAGRLPPATHPRSQALCGDGRGAALLRDRGGRLYGRDRGGGGE